MLAGAVRSSWEASCVSSSPAASPPALHPCKCQPRMLMPLSTTATNGSGKVFRFFVCLNLVCVCVHAKSLQCPTLCDPLDSSPPSSSVHGILQARILEWVAMPCSRGSSQLGDQTCVLLSPALAGRFFTTSTAWEAQVCFGSYFLVQNVNASIQKMKINHIHKALN